MVFSFVVAWLRLIPDRRCTLAKTGCTASPKKEPVNVGSVPRAVAADLVVKGVGLRGNCSTHPTVTPSIPSREAQAWPDSSQKLS